MLLFTTISILLSFIFAIINNTLSLQCSTAFDGPMQCKHFYNSTLNESSCAIWWSAKPPDYSIKEFQLPPAEYSCFSNNDLSKSFSIFNNNDYQFDEKCVYETYLPLSGFCFCKNGDFCNEKLLNNSTKLNDLISKMPPPPPTFP